MNEKCFVKQTSVNDCGVACLLMILNNYGISATMNELKNKIRIKENGVSAYEIVKVSKKYNLTCIGYKNINLENIKLPAIVHTNSDNVGHYVVLIEVLKDKVLIADPLKKIMYINRNDFLKIYSNIALVFERNYNLFNKVFSNKLLIIRILIYTFLLTIFSLLFSYSISFVINKSNLSKNIYLIGIIYFLLIGTFKSIFSYVRSIYSLKLRTLIDKLITIPTINHLFNLPYNYYHENGSGSTLSKINDLSYVKDMIFKFIEVLSVDFILILFSSIFISILNIKFMLLNIAYFLFLYLINHRYLKFHLYDTFDLQIENQNLNNKIIDSFNNILSIKNLTKEDFFKRKLSKTYSNYINRYEDTLKIYLKKELFTSVVTIFFIILNLFVLINSKLSIPNMIFAYSLENLIIDSLNDIFLLQPLYANFKSSVLRIKQIYEKQNVYDNRKTIINSISFRNLSYKYDKKYVLKNISFDISKGDYVFITGETGCGKTTLFKLLTNQIQGNKNNIYINNRRINSFEDEIIRNSILYVDQKSKLFNESIKENIFMGDKINNGILKNTLIDDMLKDCKIGLDYVIDNTNTNLSNGQISKILIARALQSKKNVIILDEVTSSLDTKTERRILMNIKNNYKDKTLILINHRKENIDIFDKVIDLDVLNGNNIVKGL